MSGEKMVSLPVAAVTALQEYGEYVDAVRAYDAAQAAFRAAEQARWNAQTAVDDASRAMISAHSKLIKAVGAS